jgi:hypothetical protein
LYLPILHPNIYKFKEIYIYMSVYVNILYIYICIYMHIHAYVTATATSQSDCRSRFYRSSLRGLGPQTACSAGRTWGWARSLAMRIGKILWDAPVTIKMWKMWEHDDQPSHFVFFGYVAYF